MNKNHLYFIILIISVFFLLVGSTLSIIFFDWQEERDASRMQDQEALINDHDTYIDYERLQESIRGLALHEQVRIVYLTFDDGPSRITEGILDVLAAYDVKATFFVNQPNRRPDLIKRMVNEGHVIGNHTYSHRYSYIYRSERNFWRDFYKLNRAVYEIAGYTPEVMRFPGGTANTVSRRYNPGIMTRLAREADRKGIRYFDWNAENGDGMAHVNEQQAFRNTVRTSRNQNVIILLMHDSMHKQGTLDALPRIIEFYHNNGYVFDVITPDTPQITHRINN